MSLLLLFKPQTNLGTPVAAIRVAERGRSLGLVLAYQAAPIRLAVRLPGAVLTGKVNISGQVRLLERAPGAILGSPATTTAVSGTIRVLARVPARLGTVMALTGAVRSEARARSTSFLLAYHATPVRLAVRVPSAALGGIVALSGVTRTTALVRGAVGFVGAPTALTGTVQSGALLGGTLTVVPSIGTIAPSGGGSGGGYRRRWEPAITPEPEPVAKPVTATAPPTLPERIGRPGPKPVPQEAEPWPPPDAVPAPGPEPAIAHAVGAVPAPQRLRPGRIHADGRLVGTLTVHDDMDAITALLASLGDPAPAAYGDDDTLAAITALVEVLDE